ncbi:FRIGIDA-like protein 4a [Iris pallida]|uniref:FRIGIDA-like protein n=1 Tax=Iris pallida TaxID=29817 RepID=A0AAX6H6Q4_IRIPA|nr:FRIGIDA-like protein 4a [Iris pallida]
MASTAAPITASDVHDAFAELEKQRELIASCTHLWKELSDHFSSLEKDLQLKADSLKSLRQTLDLSTQKTLDSLHRREETIGRSVDAAVSRLETLRRSAAAALLRSNPDDDEDLASKIKSVCQKLDYEGFLNLIVSRRKEADVLRSSIPASLSECVDPANFVLDAICDVFPVDKRKVKSPPDLTWACVLILEGLVPALEDPELGKERLLVTRSVKERARAMAREWKEGMEGRGGVGSLKPADVHSFLQHLVTFGVAEKEDRELYRKLVVGYAWRKQMPKLAVSLGLDDFMPGIIEELIGKGQQLDAINFSYEAGLQDKFPPVPLLKSFLEDSQKVTSAVSEDQNSAQANATRRKQTALRAVIKCIEDRKLEAEFPIEDLQKRLENMEKAKVEKKKPSGGGSGGSSPAPANKRTRANSGGPMPPAKAGRTTNHAYVSSFPAAPTYIRSPSSYTTYSSTIPSSRSSYPPSSHTTYSSPVPPYPYDRPAAHGVYVSRSPQAIRDPYAYPTEEVPPAPIPMSYTSAPMNYPPYGGYGNGLAPGYQQAYYR